MSQRMGDIAVRVANLGKAYRISGRGPRHDTLGDAFAAGLRALSSSLQRRGNHRSRSSKGGEFWALRDVSFEIERGEVMGAIGPNGAGKSTLLKILSQITEPTVGRAEIHGRVGSLLEVGAGFHPELTGRENIYLNGAILGMKRAEIARKFDEIVAFAEIERFLEMPVKRYSSGMYVRLAFAVAAHLEPEILLVDEVLSVGDAAFQSKCLGKMGDVAGEGRTVLFVSHNLAAVESLCGRTALLQNGELAGLGVSSQIIRQYSSTTMTPAASLRLKDRADRTGSGLARYASLRLLDDQAHAATHIAMGDPLTFELGYDVHEPIREPLFGILITDNLNRTVLRAYSRESYRGIMPPLTASGAIRCRFDALPLMYGTYSINLWMGHHRNVVIDYIERVRQFTILPKDVYGTQIVPDANNGGVCFAPHSWFIGSGEP